MTSQMRFSTVPEQQGTLSSSYTNASEKVSLYCSVVSLLVVSQDISAVYITLEFTSQYRQLACQALKGAECWVAIHSLVDHRPL